MLYEVITLSPLQRYDPLRRIVSKESQRVPQLDLLARLKARGAGLSIIVPAWMKWQKNFLPERFNRFAKEMFNLNTADESYNFV